jgi:hypothetical protein
MKKVLILAYDFPPLNSIGAQRPYSWFKYFPENELDPVVIARNPEINSNEKITVQTQKGEIYLINCENNFKNKCNNLPLLGKLIRKGLTFFEYFLKWKFSIFDNTYPIYSNSKKYILENKVDLIIATGEPWILFKYANDLSIEFNIPWIADYRDGWNTNVKSEYSLFSRLISKYYFINIEKKIVKSASLLSFSDPCESKKINKITENKEIAITLNGYDNELIDKLDEIQSNSNELIISYAGTIYDFQDLESFLIGLDRFIQNFQDRKIKVIFFGSKNNFSVIKRISKVNPELFKYISLTEKIPQNDVLYNLNNSHVLLVLSSSKHVALPAKVFEYIGLEKYILVSTNDKSDVEKFVKETSSGIICNDSSDVYNSLVSFFSLFENDRKMKIKIFNKEYYSRKHQSKLLSDTIKKLI